MDGLKGNLKSPELSEKMLDGVFKSPHGLVAEGMPILVPRLLLVGLARINATDFSGNGLLMRGLLAGWPRQALAQVYSSGNNGDNGIADCEFKLGAQERVCGRLFIAAKREVEKRVLGMEDFRGRGRTLKNLRNRLVALGHRCLVETGLYELLFPVRLSRGLQTWIGRYRPDVILAQGYSLGMIRLAMLIREYSGARLACFWSDDWPTSTYAGLLGEPRFARWLMQPILARYTDRLVAEADAPFAFGPLMAREYERRYRRPFIVINHSDDPARFRACCVTRNLREGIASLLVTGYIDRFRAPSILDLNSCCGLLEEGGVRARVCLIASAIEPEVEQSIRLAEYVEIFHDPGHADLPGHLKGADILVIAEPFNQEVADAYGLSISSKAHLFMFSERPIIVYAPAATGLARYATEAGWAEVVCLRDPARLASVIKGILSSPERQQALIQGARRIGEANHDAVANRALFVASLSGKRSEADGVNARVRRK